MPGMCLARYVSHRKGMDEMHTWNGIIKYNQYSLEATIYSDNPRSTGLKKWFGSGFSDTEWPDDADQFETNVGTIILTRRSIGPGGNTFSFTGSGIPKGPLADYLGIRG